MLTINQLSGFGAGVAGTPVEGDDPIDYANTVLLAGFDGTDEQTSFTDESAAAHGAFTFGVSAQLGTAEKKWGTASLEGRGISGYEGVSLPDHADWTFGAGVEFTIEAWVFPFDRSSPQPIVSQYRAGDSNRSWRLQLQNTTGSVQFLWSLNGTALVQIASIGTVTENVWSHVAASRTSDGTIRLFINGVLDATTGSESGAFFSSAAKLWVAGNDDQSQEFHGWVDEVRVTKGQAGYTATFDPPTSAFARS